MHTNIFKKQHTKRL